MSDKRKINIIFLRGLARQSLHWQEFLDQTQKANPHANIVGIDLPGAGEFFFEISPTSIAAIATSTYQKIKDQISNEKFYIVAISLGAMVAHAMQRECKDKVLGLVLINTSLKGINSFYERLLPKALLEFLKAFSQISIEKREEIIFKITSNKPLNKKIIQEWVAIQERYPISKRTMLHQLRAAATYEVSENDKPSCPTLLLASKNDRLCSFTSSKKISKLWGIELECHPEAGHDVTLDDPEWVVHKISTFLERQL